MISRQCCRGLCRGSFQWKSRRSSWSHSTRRPEADGPYQFPGRRGGWSRPSRGRAQPSSYRYPKRWCCRGSLGVPGVGDVRCVAVHQAAVVRINEDGMRAGGFENHVKRFVVVIATRIGMWFQDSGCCPQALPVQLTVCRSLASFHNATSMSSLLGRRPG